MRAAWGIALCVGCYHAPTPEQPCSITCTDTCPGDLTCEAGYCVQPGEVCHPTFTRVAAGNGFACAIDDTTALWCWGSNRHHVVDPGMQLSYPLATRASGDPGWQIIDGGGGQVCGIRDGRLYCWGQNDHGEVALGTPGDVAMPAEIAFTDSPSEWTAVSAGDSYTCAIGGGKLYCWGQNYFGVLGNGNDDGGDHPPTQVGALADWIAISTSQTHTCGISTSMGALCWGNDAQGESGPNGSGTVTTPVPVPLPGTPTAIATNDHASCATVDSGAVYCWGGNQYAELGDPNLVPASTSQSAQPILASDVTGWTQIQGGGTMTCGLAGNALYCWGQADSGGIGRGVWSDIGFGVTASGASAFAVGWNKNIDPLTNGDDRNLDLACAIVGGDVQCWGDNRFGQLGTGGTTMALAPTEIAGHHMWSTIDLGADHGCGLDAGALYCWGDTTLGEATGVVSGSRTAPCGASLDCDVAVPKQISFLPTFDAVGLGPVHTCALAAGAINCWGDNAKNELGSSGGTSRPRLVAAPGAQAWTGFLGTGKSSECARLGAAEQVYCWGDTLTGNVSAPARLTILDGAKQVAAVGANTDCFLDAGSTLFCQGNNGAGEYGDDSIPASLVAVSTNRVYTAIASSQYDAHTCGIRSDAQVECWGHNNFGQSMQTDAGGRPIDPVRAPFVVPGLASCAAVTATVITSCALCSGEVSCWGLDALGGIGTGQGLRDPVTVPRQVPHLDGDPWIDLRSGYGFTCARAQSGRALCWGVSGHGGVGNGVAANLPTTVVVSMP